MKRRPSGASLEPAFGADFPQAGRLRERAFALARRGAVGSLLRRGSKRSAVRSDEVKPFPNNCPRSPALTNPRKAAGFVWKRRSNEAVRTIPELRNNSGIVSGAEFAPTRLRPPNPQGWYIACHTGCSLNLLQAVLFDSLRGLRCGPAAPELFAHGVYADVG